MKKHEVFSRDPAIMNGELVFTGTRVPVKVLVQYLKAGDSLGEFLADFPTVGKEQVTAYLDHTLEAAGAGAS